MSLDDLPPDHVPAALLEPVPPWLHGWDADPAGLDAAVRSWRRAGLVCRTVRGAKMRAEQGFFDELAAALQFPDYFGENWDAVRDCLTDLDLPPGAGFVLLVRDADQLLLDAPGERAGVMLRVLETAAAEWAEPVERGEWWDRPAVPFHVVLQAGLDGVASLRARLGRELVPLPAR